MVVGSVVIILHLLLFYNTDDCLQCGSKPETPEEGDDKEVTKSSIKLADMLVSFLEFYKHD